MTSYDQVRRAQQAARLKARAFDLEREQYEIEAQARGAARDRFLEHCRPATVADYAEWLIQYLDSGGRISHSYDYPMPEFFVLTSRPAAIPSLYGALSVSVIVPAGVLSARDDLPNTFHGGCGHSTFYFLTRPPVVVGSLVPLYTDVADRILGAAPEVSR